LQLLSTKVFEGLDVVHGFTTRSGGVSTGTWGSLNLARRPEEPEAVLVENWSRVAQALGLTAEDIAILSQVHEARVVHAREPSGPLQTLASADGMWTARPGLALAVRVADCVPVLLACRGGVAVAHAGWRGTAAGVVAATVRALAEGVGCAPHEVRAAVGPHISGAAYEVGPEVVAGLVSSGLAPTDVVRPGKRGRPHVDLGSAVDVQLRTLGVTQIAHLGACTYSEDRFHSYRRDGAAAGRLAGVIARAS
jgi:hypothetical protein